MQSERTALIKSVVKAVEALKPNEAILLPSECIVARTEAGTLRYASGWFAPIWRRGDGLVMAREHVEGLLSARSDFGYYRREVAFAIEQPAKVANVGRRNFCVVRQEAAHV